LPLVSVTMVLEVCVETSTGKFKAHRKAMLLYKT
jgi:hypothetical protein